MPDYDHANIFARILRGELPCHKVYEDQHTLSFMDVMPRADGHVLVIPKAPARTLLEAEVPDVAVTFAVVQKVARAVKDAMQADGITLHQFNEQAGGQVVFHWHVHVLPRWDGVALRPHTAQMAPNDVLAAQAQKIRDALAAG
jgi:histidine triad (HIT) family protein